MGGLIALLAARKLAAAHGMPPKVAPPPVEEVHVIEAVRPAIEAPRPARRSPHRGESMAAEAELKGHADTEQDE